MGVRGLKDFVSENARDLCSSTVLKDCRLIIDGFNVVHELYYKGLTETAYGGDYDVYADSVTKLISILSKKGIEAYFVFDGIADLNDSKFSTAKSRAEDRIHLAGYSTHRKRTKILPILAFKTFIERLEERSVPFVVCDHEADKDTASLARILKCPVVSNDSDMLLFDIPDGVITVDDLNLSTVLSQSPSDDWSVRVYHMSELLQLYSVKQQEVLQLLALIAGNDHVSGELLHKLRTQLDTKSNSRAMDMNQYLRWLSKFGSADKGIKEMERFASKPRMFERIARRTLEFYNATEEAGAYLSDYFLQNQISHSAHHPLHDELPEVFWLQFRAGKFSKCLLEAVVFQRRLLLTQMEKLGMPSAWTTSVSIRRKTYTILSSSSDKPLTMVKEYTRMKKRLHANNIACDPQSCEDASPAVPAVPLAEIYSKDEDERVKLFFSLLEFDEEAAASNAAWSSLTDRCDRLLTAIILYWINHAEPAVNGLNVLALLTCAVTLSTVRRKLHTDKKLHADKKSYKQASQYSFSPIRDQKHKDGLDIDIIHSFSQFQCVLRDSLDLLGLLCIDAGIKVHKVFSGRYMYNLSLELCERVQPQFYCEELLVRGSSQSTMLKDWYQLLVQLTKDGRLLEMGNKRVSEQRLKENERKAKRSAQRREYMASLEPIQLSDGQSDNDDVSSEDLLDNRFALLAMRS